jgi:hypothetical protein
MNDLLLRFALSVVGYRFVVALSYLTRAGNVISQCPHD